MPMWCVPGPGLHSRCETALMLPVELSQALGSSASGQVGEGPGLSLGLCSPRIPSCSMGPVRFPHRHPRDAWFLLVPGKDGEVLPLRRLPEHLLQLKSKVGLSRGRRPPPQEGAWQPPRSLGQQSCVCPAAGGLAGPAQPLCLSRVRSTFIAAASRPVAAGSPTPRPPASTSTECNTRVMVSVSRR